MFELPGVSDFLSRVWNLLSAMWMSLAAPAMMSPGHWIPAVQTLVVAGFKFGFLENKGLLSARSTKATDEWVWKMLWLDFHICKHRNKFGLDLAGW